MSDGVWVKIWPENYDPSGAPGDAVIDSAVADDPDNYPVKTSSFTGDGTNGEDGQNYDVYEFLGSGELVVSETGLAEILVVAGGSGGGTGRDPEPSARRGGGGGAGGVTGLSVISEYLIEGSILITVGAGGSGAVSGNPSSCGSAFALGGSTGYSYGNDTKNTPGGSTGGGVTGVSQAFQGNAGGVTGSNATPGAGGGAGGPGEGRTPGPGVTTRITGEDRTFATGGAGGSGAGTPANATANSGDGGIGAGTPPSAGAGQPGGHGGSGIVIVRVKVAEKSFGDSTLSVTPKTAHAARVENGVVRQVITIPHLDDDDNKITEYCNKIGLPGTWVDTSYTGARRGRYAGVGDLFDPNTRNAEFISPVEVVE